MSAFCRPNMRVVRTTPPAPGSRPRETSGRPISLPLASSATRKWQASAISRPPPSAAPLIAAATGLPMVSRRRKAALTRAISFSRRSASAGVAWMIMLRSAPAKKVFFALVTMTPAMSSFSASRRSSVASSEVMKVSLRVLALPPGSSIVKVTTLSESFSQRNMLSLMILLRPAR